MLEHKLRKLVGTHFEYLSQHWRLIDVLIDQDQIVLQRIGSHTSRNLQADQYGQIIRRSPETLSLPVSAPNDPEMYSEQLLLLLRGRIDQ